MLNPGLDNKTSRKPSSQSLHDPVTVTFDWALQPNQRVLFKVSISRWGETAITDFELDLNRLNQLEAERMTSFLSAYHARRTESRDVIAFIAFALNISLFQQAL